VSALTQGKLKGGIVMLIFDVYIGPQVQQALERMTTGDLNCTVDSSSPMLILLIDVSPQFDYLLNQLDLVIAGCRVDRGTVTFFADLV